MKSTGSVCVHSVLLLPHGLYPAQIFDAGIGRITHKELAFVNGTHIHSRSGRLDAVNPVHICVPLVKYRN